MLIATFGPTTGWSGKTITFENEQFILDGHGPISAADVMTYDSQGHLIWATEGTRGWVGAKTQSPAREPAGGAAPHTDTTQALAVQDADDKPPIECYAVNYRGGGRRRDVFSDLRPGSSGGKADACRKEQERPFLLEEISRRSIRYERRRYEGAGGMDYIRAEIFKSQGGGFR